MDSGRQVGHRTEICTKVYALRKYTFIITCEDERAHTTCILLTEFELSQRKKLCSADLFGNQVGNLCVLKSGSQSNREKERSQDKRGGSLTFP